MNINKKQAALFMDRHGFYLILFVCVAVIGFTAVWASGSDEPAPEAQSIGFAAAEEPPAEPVIGSFAPAIMAGSAVKPQPPAEPVSAPKAEPEPEAEPPAEPSNASLMLMQAPSGGNYGMLFSGESLVFSRTLGQWTTHRGVDICAAEGSEVVAAMAGTVAEVRKDPLMGHTVVVEHDKGLKTVYSALKADQLPQPGAQVRGGDVIGLVGSSALAEVEEGPHLHFEVWMDGTAVDPLTLLPEAEE